MAVAVPVSNLFLFIFIKKEHVQFSHCSNKVQEFTFASPDWPDLGHLL